MKEDYRVGYGKVRGLLSPRQIADYHHQAFRIFGVAPDNYGGTWLAAVPDGVEFRIYGFLYCHDCDTEDGYAGADAR